MRTGKAWVILEEHFHTRERHLVSILSPKKTTAYISSFVEQIYVDKFASIREKITYKKDRKRSAYRMEQYEKRGPTMLSCGHEPKFRAYFCHRLALEEDRLTFTYRVLRKESDGVMPAEFDEFEGHVDVT